MEIVDAQIHLWQGPNAPPHHRLGRTTYSYQDAVRDMDAAGVHAAINCPPIWDETANAYAAHAALAYPDRFATLDWFDITDAEPEVLLERTLARPGVIGLRFLTASPRAIAGSGSVLGRLAWPEDGEADWLWAELAARRKPVALYGAALLPQVGSIANRFPELRIIIDHFGSTGGLGADGSFQQMPGLVDLASLPNVAVKLTAAPAYAIGSYPFASVHPVIQLLYHHYGPERLFWGTDITRLHVGWRECVTMFIEHMPWLPPQDLRLIMGEALRRWYGWKPDGG